MNLSVRFSDAKQMKRVIAIAIACSMLLVLPSCIPILRRPLPAPELPEDFRGETTPENTAQVGVEEFYNDPVLLCLLNQAVSPGGNRELKILNEEVQIARNEILARSGAYLPFMSFGARTGLTDTAASRKKEPAYMTTSISPGSTLPIRLEISGGPQPHLAD